MIEQLASVLERLETAVADLGWSHSHTRILYNAACTIERRCHDKRYRVHDHTELPALSARLVRLKVARRVWLGL